MKYLKKYSILIFTLLMFSTCSLLIYNEANREKVVAIEGPGFEYIKSHKQEEIFGFNLQDKYEMHYMLGYIIEFKDYQTEHTFLLKESDTKEIKDLFKKNTNNQFKEIRLGPIACQYVEPTGPRTYFYSKKTIEETKKFKELFCQESQYFNAQCIVVSEYDSGAKEEICLSDKYVRFFWGAN